MMEENNYYKDKGKRKFLDLSALKEKNKEKNNTLQGNEPETGKEKLNRTLKGVGKDLAVGVLAGGLGAALFGRYSFVAGLAISGYGHYAENTALTTFGLGMMSSSSMTAAKGVNQNPNATTVEKIQERVKAFGEELQRKLFLDKLTAAKNDAKPVLSGIENKKEPPAAEVFKPLVNKTEEQAGSIGSETEKEPEHDTLLYKKENRRSYKASQPLREFDPRDHLF